MTILPAGRTGVVCTKKTGPRWTSGLLAALSAASISVAAQSAGSAGESGAAAAPAHAPCAAAQYPFPSAAPTVF